jgi:hypothetical protein
MSRENMQIGPEASRGEEGSNAAAGFSKRRRAYDAERGRVRQWSKADVRGTPMVEGQEVPCIPSTILVY